MDAWKNGFITEEAIFEWAASSRLFHVKRLAETESNSNTRQRTKRGMYKRFQDWAQHKQADTTSPEPDTESVITEALVYFQKKSEYETLMKEYSRVESILRARRKVKPIFNGTLVGRWTELDNRRVKLVMDAVRERFGGEVAMAEIDVEDIHKTTVEVAHQLGLMGMQQVDVHDINVG